MYVYYMYIVHVQYRSCRAYRRASSMSNISQEFECVKLKNYRSSTRQLVLKLHLMTQALALETSQALNVEDISIQEGSHWTNLLLFT